MVCRVCWEVYPIRVEEGGVRFPFGFAPSRALADSLSGCSQALVFAATVGLGMDRLIARYERVSPSHALLLHGIGAERIESLCDAFCRARDAELAGEGLSLRPRFSPGYGDLPLAFQREVFGALDCRKHIGLTLEPSLIMSPSKSVTAIAGISPRKAAREGNKCAACSKTDCAYRR